MMHRVLFAAGVAAFVVTGLAFKPAAAEDAAALLARHKAYVGWAYGDGTLKSARVTVVAESPSPAPSPSPAAQRDPLAEPDGHVEVRREFLYRDTFSASDHGSEASGFTGSVFWESDVNGYTVTQHGRVARIALTRDLIDAEALSEAPSESRPNVAFDGKPVAVVRIAPKNGVPADLYFNAVSGALAGYRLDPDNSDDRSTIRVVEYAEFAPGKRYVSAYRFGRSHRTYRVTRFEANVPVSDADLHPPAPTSAWTFGEPSTVPVSVVLHTQQYSSIGRSVHVDATVNGHVGHFLFDSGAGGVLVFEPLAKAAGLVDVGHSAYSGVNGVRIAATDARVDSLSIGGNTLHNLIVTRSEYGFSGVDGIIGYDVLAGAVVDVDLVAKTLTIHDPATFEAPTPRAAFAFPIDNTAFHAGVPLKVNDQILRSVWLDTGDDFFVILPHLLEKKTISLDAGFAYFGGVDGGSNEPARCVRLNEIRVGPFRYQNALSCFAPTDVFDPDGGLVGFDFLRHFNWTFDYPHGRVILTQNGL